MRSSYSMIAVLRAVAGNEDSGHCDAVPREKQLAAKITIAGCSALVFRGALFLQPVKHR